MRHLIAAAALLLGIDDAELTPLTYALAPDSPAGARVDPATGVFSWTPEEDQGPGRYTITVEVSDGQATARRSFEVQVREVNRPPEIAPVPDQAVDEGQTLIVPIYATDPDTMPKAPFRPVTLLPPPPGEGTVYHLDLSLSGSGGDGTPGNPWRLGDAVTASNLPGPLWDVPVAGDTVRIAAGDFSLTPAGSYEHSLFCFANSGTEGTPITLEPEPGAFVRLRKASGTGMILGTRRASGMKNYHRIRGFETRDTWLRVYGTGHEISHNRPLGRYKNTNDNNVGIRMDYAVNCWVHHNDISGWTGAQYTFKNSLGIECYEANNSIIEYNSIQGCGAGIWEKSQGINNIVRYNLIRNVHIPWDSNLNNTADGINSNIHDNIFWVNEGGYLEFVGKTYPNLLHHNLFIGTAVMMFSSEINSGNMDQIDAHSNICLFLGTSGKAFEHRYKLWEPIGPDALFTRLDYNIYSTLAGGLPNVSATAGQYVPPTNTNTTTFANWTAIQGTAGAEANGQRVAITDLFEDGTYNVKATYLAAGKDGTKPGPADPAGMLDIGSYGPDVLGYTTPDATALTLVGPATGPVGGRSGSFTIIPDGKWGTGGTVTPSDGGAGGTFRPSSHTWAAGEAAAKSFDYTAASSGSKTITLSNTAGLTNPASHTYN